MANSETLAHILAEIRSDEAAKVMATGLLWQDMSFQFNSWADRIEAACKRERIQRDKVSFRCGDCARFGDDCDAGDSDGNEDRVACEKFVRRALVPGNAAAMRSTLEQLCRMCSHNGHDFGIHAVRLLLDHLDMMKAVAQCALDAPARNCDRFNSGEEAWIAFERERPNWCDEHSSKDPDCDDCEMADCGRCMAEWLFATEGGAE